MMRNKKAWIRIVEAFVAILIITSVLLISISKVPQKDKNEEIHKIQRGILTQISLNDVLRAEILGGNIEQTAAFIDEVKPGYWDFSLRVCDLRTDDICSRPGEYIDKEIYADEILISSTLQDYDPKVLKMFVWEK